MGSSSGYSREDSYVTEYSPGDDHTARRLSAEVERGGEPELPVVRMPPERPPI